VTEPDEAFRQAFHPERRIRIEEYVFGSLVLEDCQYLRTELPSEFLVKPVIELVPAGSGNRYWPAVPVFFLIRTIDSAGR
jgi:hypothetical protein